MFDVRVCFDIDVVYLFVCWFSLVCDQCMVEYFFGFFCGFFYRFGQMNVVFFVSIGFFERIFVVFICVDLSFNDLKRFVQFIGCSFGIFCFQNCMIFGNWGVVRVK